MQRTSPVPIFVSFASSSGPNDIATGTTALLSSSSIWKLLSPIMTTQLPACELHLLVSVILLMIDRIMEEAFCDHRQVRWPFVGVNHGADFALPLDQRNVSGFVPPLCYKVAAIVTLAKFKDPRPIDSPTVIPHILHVSFLIIGHSWHVGSQYITLYFHHPAN